LPLRTSASKSLSLKSWTGVSTTQCGRIFNEFVGRYGSRNLRLTCYGG
jgi:hypothetical protein